jgi:tRNA1Val (adenine37-N6)-methyltransferase
MTGVELQPDAARLAEENLRLNGMTDRGTILCGDLREEHAALPRGGFDFVIANPPYFAEGSGLPAPEEGRAAARGESRCTLEDLCTRVAGLCRSGGKVFLSYRPERLCELLRQCAHVRLEPKRLRLVSPRSDRAPSLVLVEGRRGGNPGLTIEQPLVLQDETGADSLEMQRIYHMENQP